MNSKSRPSSPSNQALARALGALLLALGVEYVPRQRSRGAQLAVAVRAVFQRHGVGGAALVKLHYAAVLVGGTRHRVGCAGDAPEKAEEKDSYSLTSVRKSVTSTSTVRPM